MFFPIKTEAHDGQVRFGSIGIIVACLILHIVIGRDSARREEKMGGLERELQDHRAGKHFDDMLKDVGGEGVFDDGSPARARDSAAAVAKAELQEEREASLFYKLALVEGDFNPINLITHMFVHADWLHLIFNMWFFYLVGVTMEKYWGLGRFLLLYLACGIAAALGFMLVSGAKSRGIPMVGASGAIAGMMGAFMMTHGSAKVTLFWTAGFRGGTIPVSARVYLGFWIAGQLWDAFVHSGQAGGVAFMAHVAGFFAGVLVGKKVPADVFYQRAYKEDGFAQAIEKLEATEKLIVPEAKPVEGPKLQDGSEIMTLLNQGRHALESGNGPAAAGLIASALEKSFAVPGLDPKIRETALIRVLESQPAAVLPGGALYSWARRLEGIDWWQWAIRFYDAAAVDATGATNPHAMRGAWFRAAAMRMDRGYEKDNARRGFEAILAGEPDGNFAEEAAQRLKAMGPAPAYWVSDAGVKVA